MKKLALYLAVIASFVACNEDSDPSFAIYARADVFQYGYADTAYFVPQLQVNGLYVDYKLDTVRVFSANSKYRYLMHRRDDYEFMADSMSIVRLSDLNASYAIQAVAQDGKISELPMTYNVSDTLLIGEFKNSELKCEGRTLSAKISKAKNATVYGFAICRGVKGTDGKVTFPYANESYVYVNDGRVTFPASGEATLSLTLQSSLSSSYTYRLSVVAQNKLVTLRGESIIVGNK